MSPGNSQDMSSSVATGLKLQAMSFVQPLMTAGTKTASMTCTTPLSAVMSATVTVAVPLIMTVPSMMAMVTSWPLTVVTGPSVKSVLKALTSATW